MSVTCVVHAASDPEIAGLLQAPETIHDFLGNATPGRVGCLAGLFGGRAAKVVQSSRPENCDLDKSWEALHFVLSGGREESPLPAGFLRSGGEYVGDEDIGYEPARALPAAAVRELAAFLSAIPRMTFESRIDQVEMARLEIYGAPFPDDPEGLAYLVDDYERLRSFIGQCAENEKGILIQYV